MYRLFVAIDPPDKIKSRINSICCGLNGVKWEKEDQFHLTLRFIGETDSIKLEDICSSLSKISGESFSLRINGVGFFPPKGSSRVLWAVIEEKSETIKLHKNIVTALNSCGIEGEHRKFSPHITLGRTKNCFSKDIADYLCRNNRFSTESFKVSHFYLYSSLLTQKGAIHEKMFSFNLNS